MKQATASHGHVGRVALLVVAGLLLAVAWTFFYSGPAQAQADPYSTQTPKVLPTRITDDNEKRDPVDGDRVQGLEGEDRSGVLPFTGGDVVLFLVIGAAAVGTGSILVRRTRSDN